MLTYLSILPPARCPFHCFSFVVSFEIKQSGPPALFLVLQVVSAVRGPPRHLTNCRTGFSISVKMPLELCSAVRRLGGSPRVPLPASQRCPHRQDACSAPLRPASLSQAPWSSPSWSAGCPTTCGGSCSATFQTSSGPREYRGRGPGGSPGAAAAPRRDRGPWTRKTGPRRVHEETGTETPAVAGGLARRTPEMQGEPQSPCDASQRGDTLQNPRRGKRMEQPGRPGTRV